MAQVTVVRAYKMMLDPHQRHIARMDEHISDARWMYNWTLRTIDTFDKFRQFKSEYLDDKVREAHNAIFYTKSKKRQEFAAEQGLTMLDADASKEFRKEHDAAANAHAKARNAEYRDALRREIETAEGITEEHRQAWLRAMSCTAFALSSYWTHVRDEQMPWHDKVSTSRAARMRPIQNAVDARQRFFKNPAENGYPRYKEYGGSQGSFYVPNEGLKLLDKHPRRIAIRIIAPSRITKEDKEKGVLPGVRVQDKNALKRLRRALSQGGKINSGVISRAGGRYYLSISVTETITVPDEPTPAQRANGSVGVDLGVSHLAILSDGTFVENKRPGKRSESRIKTLQRSKARKRASSVDRTTGDYTPASSRYKKAVAKIAKAQHLTQLRRHTALHQLTKILANNYDSVYIEDLNVKGMTARAKVKPDKNNPGQYLPNGAAAKSGLAKAVLDVGFYEFKRQLQYKKPQYSGAQLVLIPRYAATTQTCSVCGTRRQGKDKIKLSERTFVCINTDCGHVEDRDLNAARNIKKMGIEAISETM